MTILYSGALCGLIAWRASGFQGDLTAYTLSSPSSGNCNFMTWPGAATLNYAAINDAQWNDGLECGRCAKVTCADPVCVSKASEIVYIMDRCPECAFGDLDVSFGVFTAVTGLGPSRLKLQWDFVECPNTKNNIQICLKSGSNPYWAAVQPASMPNGVKRMEINGRPASQLGSAYYFKVEDSNGMDLSRVRLSMASASGQVYDQMVALSAGNCIDAAAKPSIRRPTFPNSQTSGPVSAPASPSAENSAVKDIGPLAFASNYAQKAKNIFTTPVIAAVVGCVAAVCLIALTAYAIRKRPQNAQTPQHGGNVAMEAAAVDLTTRGHYKSQIAIL